MSQQVKSEVGKAAAPPSASGAPPEVADIQSLYQESYDPGHADPGQELTADDPLRDHIYLHVRDKFEREIAEEWIQTYVPKLPWENLTDQLDLMLLRPTSVIYYLGRKGHRRAPVTDALRVTGARNPEGFLVHETTPIKAMMAEMKAWGGVKVATYVTRAHTRMSAALNYDGVINAIAAVAVPDVIHYADIGEVDKPRVIYFTK